MTTTSRPTTDATPATVPGRARRMVAPTLVIGGLAAATVALHFRDPHTEGSWGLCPWLVLTGSYCPGCGGLRAVNDLSNGDIVSAASSNLLFVATVPLIVYGLGRWVVNVWTGTRHANDPKAVRLALWVMPVVLVVFTVLRNTPYGAWLAP